MFLRGTMPDVKRYYVMPLFPVIPMLGIATKFVIALSLWTIEPIAWIVALGWIGIGLLVHYLHENKEIVIGVTKVVESILPIHRRRYHILLPIADLDPVELVDLGAMVGQVEDAELTRLQVRGNEAETGSHPCPQRAGMACIVRDRLRDPVGEKAPREDHDPERGPDGPGAGERTRVQRATRGDVPYARRALRGKIREDPEHRGHGRGRGEGIRPARPRGVLGMAAHPVRVRSDAGPDCPPHGHPDVDGPKGPSEGGTGVASKSFADPCGPPRATGIE